MLYEVITLHLIEQVSRRQRVIWVRGNHDDGYAQNGFKHIHFKTYYTIENRLLIAHGYDFDDIMSRRITSYNVCYTKLLRYFASSGGPFGLREPKGLSGSG